MKRLIFVFFGFLFLIILIGSTVSAVMIQPMVLKIKAKPGETVPFKIKITSKQQSPEEVNFTLAQPMQKLNGAFEFKPADPVTFPEVNWVSLNTSNIIVPKGEEKEVSGSIKVPFDARGYHMIVLMAGQPPISTKAVVLAVQYAIKLEINIDAPLPRQTAEVTDFELVKGTEGEPCMEFNIKNTSQMQYGMDASVLVRNNNTKKLIERVQLKPAYYFTNSYEPVIIPGANLQFIGTPKELLLPGQYDLQLVFRYGTSGQILKKKTVEVKTGDFNYPAAKLKVVRIDQNEISFSAKPGGTSLKGIKFENRSNKTVKIELKPEDNISYPYSILKNTIVEFKNGREFILEPGRITVAVMAVKFPQNARVQGNYSQLKVVTFATDGNPDPIEETTISLEALTLGKYTLTAEATDLAFARDNDKFLLSVIVKNTGNIKIAPQATLYLKNDKGKNVDTVKLSVQENNNFVLPMQFITLTGITNENLTPGKYKAEIKISQGNEEIGNSVYDLQMK